MLETDTLTAIQKIVLMGEGGAEKGFYDFLQFLRQNCLSEKSFLSSFNQRVKFKGLDSQILAI